jgi:threonine dehydrogenase-like Zn-dependent dehydrogenase
VRALRVIDGTPAVVDAPIPAAAGEALVRVTLSGICNTDRELARGYMGFAGTLGHEFVGVIAEPGDGPLPRGARVVGEINAGCGACPGCVGGDPRHCPTRTVLGILGRDGAHADYLRLPARNLVAVPANVTDAQAVFVEPLAAACGVLERAAVAPGMAVAVIGDGKLGLLCALALAATGHPPVLFGKHAAKLDHAARRGIETMHATAAPRRARSFDVVIEASGNASGFDLALELLRPLGTLVLKSTFHGRTPIDAARIVIDEVRVVGSRCGRFAPALALLAQGAIAVDDLITDVVGLDDAAAALARAGAPGVLKLLLAP